MENFTDLFGDDLAGLDGLDGLGTFGSSSDQIDSNNQSGGQNLEMLGGGSDSQQQQQQQHPQQPPGSNYHPQHPQFHGQQKIPGQAPGPGGYNEYNYRPGGPQHAGQFPPGYGPGGPGGPSGYPPGGRQPGYNMMGGQGPGAGGYPGHSCNNDSLNSSFLCSKGRQGIVKRSFQQKRKIKNARVKNTDVSRSRYTWFIHSFID